MFFASRLHSFPFSYCAPNFPIVSATCEDYTLLENMNKITSLKYMEMKDISINISRNLQDLNNKCEYKIYVKQPHF